METGELPAPGSELDLLEALRRFAAKEREMVFRRTFGVDRADVDSEFLAAIGKVLGVKVPKVGNFVALDYHLDWLVAALTCVAESKWRGIPTNE